MVSGFYAFRPFTLSKEWETLLPGGPPDSSFPGSPLLRMHGFLGPALFSLNREPSFPDCCPKVSLEV